MIVIFTGSRTITSWYSFEEALGRLFKDFPNEQIEEVFVGDAPKGVDVLARRYAEVSLKQKPRIFYADWDRHKPADPSKKNPAGMIRNEEMIRAGMAERAKGKKVAVVGIWDGVSPGTRHCTHLASQHGLPTVVVIMKPDEAPPQEHIDEALGRKPKPAVESLPKTTPGRRKKDENQFSLFDMGATVSGHNDEN